MSYVDEIGCSYTVQPDASLLFEDGVRYTLSEALMVSRSGAQGDDLAKLHLVKKAFDGEIVGPVVSAREKCPVCRGKGRRWHPVWDTYYECRDCDGSGYVPDL